MRLSVWKKKYKPQIRLRYATPKGLGRGAPHYATNNHELGKWPPSCSAGDFAIDDELMLLASRERHPCIRSDSAILAEFPTLKWNGPYRAAKYLFIRISRGLEWKTIRRCDCSSRTGTFRLIIDLLRDIQISIQGYVDTIEGLYGSKEINSAQRLPGRRRGDKNFEALKKAIGNA